MAFNEALTQGRPEFIHMEVETLGSKANARLWLTALQRVDSIEPWAAEQATAETAELTMNLASTKHPNAGQVLDPFPLSVEDFV